MPIVKVNLQRSEKGKGNSVSFERHEIEMGDRASVLDVLFALQRGVAPDLAFRFSCRVGMCGSCAMVVNGREKLTCSTLVSEVGSDLTIQPLRNLPVVRDLAVDMSPFFDAYKRAQPNFVLRADLDPSEFYTIPHASKEWQTSNHQPQCIDCGVCYSACALVTLRPNYLGPMALHRALTLISDPRDGRHDERLQAVGGESGALRCHTLGNCREACPRGISPTRSIQRLKRMSAWGWLRAWFRR